MRLKKLEIGRDGENGYKNLIDFKLDFTTQDGLTILIGNNGSGKSNIIEAISIIFYKLYIDDIDNIEFKFLIEYQKNEQDYRIHNLRNVVKFSINNNSIDKSRFYSSLTDNLPDKIFTLYSGEELRLWEECYFTPYEDYYKGVIQNSRALNSLKMNYINKYFWNIAILLLYIKNESKIKNILGDFNIDKIKFEVDSTKLQQYHTSSPNNVTRVISELRNKIDSENQISLEDFKSINYINEYGEEINIIDIVENVYYILLVALLPKDDNFKTLKSLYLSFDNGLDIKSFSEGQKKEILVTFITEILASQDSLFLLDEPDSHIHPIRKTNLIEILQTSDTQSIIMTTHSPTLIKDVDVKHLVLIKDGKAEDTDKIKALDEITNGKWAIDSINNVLIANKDILLVEGKTDIEYIKTALEKLKEYKRDRERYTVLDFTYLSFGGASGLVNFIDKFNVSENQKVIALLDKDKAGKESFCKVFTDKNENNLSNDDYESIHEIHGVKVIFLPTIDNENVFEIEDYFTVEKLKKFGKKIYDDANFSQLKDFFNIKDQIKKQLPEKCREFNKSDFKHFRKLFDKLVEIKGN